MTPVFDYVCKTCGTKTELDRRPAPGSDMRHLVGGKVCGVFRRVYSTIALNRVPGGGRA